MEEILSRLVGRRVDIRCVGAPSLRGEVTEVEGHVLHLKDEEGQIYYIAVDKISAVWEVQKDESRAGFMSLKK
jgi:hypothetical protein